MQLICCFRGYFCVLIVMHILTENIKITQKISMERSLKNVYFERLFEHKRYNASREIIFYVNSLEKKFGGKILVETEF